MNNIRILLLTVTVLFFFSFSGTDSESLLMDEICNNGIDDDGDGLIDCFDPDCCESGFCDDFYYEACVEETCPFAGSFNFEIQADAIFPEVELSTTEFLLAGDVTQDGVVDLLGVQPNGQIILIDVNQGATIDLPTMFGFIKYAVGDVIPGRDGIEILGLGLGLGGLLCADASGNQIWKTIGEIEFSGSVGISDFNFDGFPEVYADNYILDGRTGAELMVLPYYENSELSSITQPYDVFDDAFCSLCKGLEYLIENKIYSIDVESATFDLVTKATGVPDGVTGVFVDWDLDQSIDVLFFGQDRLYVWDPYTNSVNYSAPFNTFGNFGMPNIGNLDNDSEPELAIISVNKMIIFDNDLTEKLTIPVVDDSGFTGLTLFDINNDKVNEIIYRDEENLMIIDAIEGTIVKQHPCKSATGYEYPIVVDIDNDHEAEILCVCGDTNKDVKGVLTVLSSSNGSKWADSRPVWNQNNYYNVHVNDDLSIPVQMQGMAEVSHDAGLNGFLNQYAVPEVVERDLSIDSTNAYSCEIVEFRICNEKSAVISGQISYTFYNHDPRAHTSVEQVSFSHVLLQPLDSGDCVIISKPISDKAFHDQDLYVVINDSGNDLLPLDIPGDFPTTDLAECDYSNNILAFAVTSCSEICDNNLDDDADGLVDFLDPDCPCEASDWNITLPYNKVEVLCDAPFEILVEDRDSLYYQWYYQGVPLNNEESSALLLDPIVRDWTGYIHLEVYNNNGCQELDSIEIMFPTDSTKISEVVCSGTGFIYVMDTLYPGTYYYYFMASPSGCDSVLELTVTESIPDTSFYMETICVGEEYDFNGQLLTASGIYQDTILDDDGCQVIDILELKVSDKKIRDLSFTICDGDLLFYEGKQYSEAGVYFDTLFSTSGCDTIERISLTVNEMVESEVNARICEGETYFFKGIDLKEEGVYQETLTAENGCDSIIILTLDAVVPIVLLLPEYIELLAETDTFLQLELPLEFDGEINWYNAGGDVVGRQANFWARPIHAPYLVLEVDNGCLSMDTVYIEEIKLITEVHFPNIFSPNDDGLNDLFIAKGQSIQSTHTLIFDRWGGLISETSDDGEGDSFLLWDGKTKGKIVDVGSYAYKAEISYLAGKNEIIHGIITVVK